MQYTQHLTIDVFKQEQFQYIHAKQYDHCARQLVITPTANGEPLTIPETATAVFRCLKHDGTSVMDPATVDATAGTITFELTDQALACEGMARADVSLIDGENIISTLTFFILVDKAAMSNEQIASTNEFLFIVQTAAEVKANAQAAEEAAERAAGSETAAADAKQAAENAATAAAGLANSAYGSANAAAASEQTASGAAATATEKATEAGNSADAAKTSQNEAEKAKSDAESAKDAAKTSEGNAKSHQEAAKQAATDAEGSAKDAADSEQAAKDAADTAETKATEAAESAEDALNSKNAAAESEVNAGNSAKAAADSEAAAKAAQAAAEAAKNEAQGIVGGDYATKEYVQQNGGKINSISVNGTAQNIDGNKNVNITVPKNTSQLTNDAGFAKQSAVDSLSEEIVDLRGDIPKVPVQSINGKTGTVVLSADDVGATTEEWVQTELNILKAQGLQQTPLKPEGSTTEEQLAWLAENGDTTKHYLLKDGFLYAYEKTTVVNDGPAYTNQLPLATDTDRKTIYDGDGYKTSTRLSSDGSVKSYTGNTAMAASGFIPAKPNDTLHVAHYDFVSGTANYIISYNSSNTKIQAIQINIAGEPFGIFDATNMTDRSFSIPLTEERFGSGFDAIRISGGLDSETIISINDEIKEGGGTSIVETWAKGQAFVPADYDEEIARLKSVTTSHTAEIANLKDAVKSGSLLMFISPDGNDENDGLTVDTPKKTVTACVADGATRISAKRGVYNEIVYLSDIGEIEIFPTDNDQEYSTTEEWNPIVFEAVDYIAPSDLTAYNSIRRVAYSNSENMQFDKVFISKSQSPLYGGDYGSRYNATMWLLSEDEKSVCIKLKPVLTVAECEAEVNTFTYVSGYIYINANMTGVAKVVVPTNWGTGFYIGGAEKIVLREVESRFSGSYNLDIRNCPNIDLYKCRANYTSYGSGFHPVNVDGVLNNCYATKNYDGCGPNGYGHTTYIDCVFEFNFDDGVSHHNGTKGTFIGGRYEGNGKGGNTPAYGAEVNIYGGLYKDNTSFGIGYLYTSTHNPAKGIVQGAVMVGNKVGIQVDANCPVTMMSCLFKDNETERNIKGDTLTEYGTIRE